VGSASAPITRPTVAGIPVPVAAELGIAEAVPDPNGGSSATVWQVRTEAGIWLVVKTLTERDDLVDGHDLDTFTRKPGQIAAVHRELPGLSPYYTSVVGCWQGPGWAAYAMPRYAGRAVTLPLDGARPDVDGFLRDLGAVLGVLTETGYARRSWPAAPDHFVTTHLDRVGRREVALPAVCERHGITAGPDRAADPEAAGDRPLEGGQAEQRLGEVVHWIPRYEHTARIEHGELRIRETPSYQQVSQVQVTMHRERQPPGTQPGQPPAVSA